MIKTPTVFVLGAGASAPYGFPTGRALVDLVIENLRGDGYEQLARSFPAKEGDIHEFATQLERSRKNSVDAFLEHRGEFLDIGKAAIAQVLVPCETEAALFSRQNEHDWYRYLLDRMDAKYSSFGNNAVSFLTFNYDRSLEHYLNSALSSTFGKPPKDIARLLEDIPIVHVHGHLMRLPWQGSGGREYSPELTIETLVEASKNIRIVSEMTDVSTDRLLQRARELITRAQRVCFLGFGYSESNLDRIGLPHLLRGKEAHGSAKSLSQQERARVDFASEGLIKLAGSHLDTLDAIRESIPLN